MSSKWYQFWRSKPAPNYDASIEARMLASKFDEDAPKQHFDHPMNSYSYRLNGVEVAAHTSAVVWVDGFPLPVADARHVFEAMERFNHRAALRRGREAREARARAERAALLAIRAMILGVK